MDECGFVDYWKPGQQFKLPNNLPRLWSFESQTDLYKKVCSHTLLSLILMRSPDTIFPANINTYCTTLPPDSSSFITFFLPNCQIHIFSFLTEQLMRKYNESFAAIQEMQQTG